MINGSVITTKNSSKKSITYISWKIFSLSLKCQNFICTLSSFMFMSINLTWFAITLLIYWFRPSDVSSTAHELLFFWYFCFLLWSFHSTIFFRKNTHLYIICPLCLSSSLSSFPFFISYCCILKVCTDLTDSIFHNINTIMYCSSLIYNLIISISMPLLPFF